MEKILVISPHTDDVELACGGTIAKFIKQSKIVYYVAFSDCQDTLLGKFPKETLRKECKKATRTLGIQNKNCFIFNFTNKHFYKESRQIFDKLEEFKNLIKPDLVLIPSLSDTHGDHGIVNRQAITVFRRTTSIIAYEQPWSNIGFSPFSFVELSEEDMKKKYRALKCYQTQHYFKRSYFDKDFIYGWARMRGMQINAKYAEGFEVIKYIIR